jgi:ubiquinone/menaquinone biosynthesis C-methylase UbiE
MRKHLPKYFTATTDRLSSVLLDNPFLFNYVRYLLAGKQTGMKHFIKKYLDDYRCKSIADICSGTGDFAELSPEDALYIGLDLNDDFINYAKKRYKNHKNKSFIKADILKPHKTYTKKFDAVLLISTIHHFSDDELKVMLPLVKKMTKKVVIIADIIPDAPHVIQRFFAAIDRGKYVRPKKEKLKILKKYFKIKYTEEIPTRSAVQYGIICEI